MPALLGAAAALCSAPAWCAPAYAPITPSMSDRTVTLTGHDLSIEQIVMVARYGAKVELERRGAPARGRHYGLLLEAAAEGVPVYWFNRGSGDQRETVMFKGDPLSPKNKALSGEDAIWRFQLRRPAGLRAPKSRRGDRARHDGGARQ